MHITRYLPWLLLLAVIVSPFSLSGCNTVSGAGQDIEAAGDAIEDKAKETKPY
jgi:predicted small secreted protein